MCVCERCVLFISLFHCVQLTEMRCNNKQLNFLLYKSNINLFVEGGSCQSPSTNTITR